MKELINMEVSAVNYILTKQGYELKAVYPNSKINAVEMKYSNDNINVILTVHNNLIENIRTI